MSFGMIIEDFLRVFHALVHQLKNMGKDKEHDIDLFFPGGTVNLLKVVENQVPSILYSRIISCMRDHIFDILDLLHSAPFRSLRPNPEGLDKAAVSGFIQQV